MNEKKMKEIHKKYSSTLRDLENIESKQQVNKNLN